jgi:hypothetical protein
MVAPMLANILKLILVLALGAVSLALLFTFGLIVLMIIGIATPIAYIYMRLKHPEIFKAMRQHQATQNQEGYGENYSRDYPRPNDTDEIIEVEYERVDDKK